MKSTKVIIAIVALSLAAGLFGGYRIWGTKDKEPVDIKQLLQKLEEEVDLIEKKNKDLVASIEASKGDIEASEAVRKENQALKDQLQGALQEKTGLESSLAESRAKETDAVKQAEREIAEKEGVLDQVRSELSESREKASKGEEYKLLTDDLNARISALEKENRELRSVIDNISEITQRKQETR